MSVYSFETILERVNQEVSQLKFQSNVPDLYSPIHYSLSLGGKRIRPILSLMGANLFSDDIQLAMPSAIGVEIFHNFTLLHDDVMDRADVRRGKPTVHKVWNENSAILSGDAMLIVAYEAVCTSQRASLPELLSVFSRTAREVCEGQQLDMAFESRSDVTTEEYLEMIRLKTAVLLGCSLQMGAISVGASKEDQEQLYVFGENLGIAFQLKDDLLDVYGDPLKFGKEIGGDIVCNKKTFLLLEALRVSNDETRQRLLSIMNDGSLQKDLKVKMVTSIFNEIDVKKLCVERMSYYSDLAIASLQRLGIADERKVELISLADMLLSREM
ncbi:MAG: polyprenyl synthetase family protein [Bacteroidales bacterium]